MARTNSDSDVIKALGHPVRRQVMTMLERGVASPKEMAGELGLSIPNVSYHVGILRDLGLIKVVRETPRRGAMERHYSVASRAVTVRHVMDWMLAADRQRPRGWDGKIVELDGEGRSAVSKAIDQLWAEIDTAARGSAERAKSRGDKADVVPTAVGTVSMPGEAAING